MDGQVVCRSGSCFRLPRSLGLGEEETKGADGLMIGARAVKRGDKKQPGASARNDRGDGRREEEMAWALVAASGEEAKRVDACACLFRPIQCYCSALHGRQWTMVPVSLYSHCQNVFTPTQHGTGSSTY